MSVSRETAATAHLGHGRDVDPVSRETGRRSASPSLAAALLLVPIRAYRRLISPALTPRCRYYPSCSAYAEESIRELGVLRGALVAAWRVLRCNPFSAGGLDPLAERRLFAAPAPSERGESR